MSANRATATATATALVVLLFGAPLTAQQPERSRDTSRVTKSESPARIHRESHHTTTIGGEQVEYDATVGNIILRNRDDEPIGELIYTAYTRTGAGDSAGRPIMFAYNGGPGSSSVWVHMGLLGPKRVDIPDAEHAPPPPYHLVDNQSSLLDVTDLVFIDPIGTGYSKPIGKGKGTDFWGVDQDASSLAQFISRYLSENGRWNSPRYLMGESYGTTRSAVLADVLANRYSIDLNGIVLLSAVLDFQTITFNSGNDMPFVMYLPSYAAVAWYHKALPNRPNELRPFLHEVEQFATHEYATALLAGSTLPAAERDRILDRLVAYTGLDRDYLDKADLRVTAGQFEKELLREHGEVIGRLDARFLGESGDLLAENAGYDPQSSAISSPYVSLFNQYMHEELGFGADRLYAVSGSVNPWNWSHGRGGGWPGHTNAATDLAEVLSTNPGLHVQLHSGLFDLATPYFAAEWTMDHLGVRAPVRARVEEIEYESGHMAYVHPESLTKWKTAVSDFIARTSGGN